MFRFQDVGVGFLDFDQVSFTKTLDRILGEITREAAREWLRAWISTGIPVETGMAKAALVPLGRFLNNVGGLGISPTREPYYSKLYNETQDIAAGERRSHFVIRDNRSNPGSFYYKFEWTTDVIHYYFSEFYNGTATPGDEALEIAERAYLDFVDEAIKRRIPKVADHLRVSPVHG